MKKKLSLTLISLVFLGLAACNKGGMPGAPGAGGTTPTAAPTATGAATPTSAPGTTAQTGY